MKDVQADTQATLLGLTFSKVRKDKKTDFHMPETLKSLCLILWEYKMR